MTSVIAWPEIESFHNVRKYLRIDPQDWWRAKQQMHGTSVVEYKCKVKLHGTNSAIQVHTNGDIVCQSRTGIITPEKDNAGFARWVMENKEPWHEAMGYIIYGEWCGKGIQKGVALADLPKKVFAVFAARPLPGDILHGDNGPLIIEPYDLWHLVENIPDTYVLPWYARIPMHGMDTRVDCNVPIDWKQTDEELTKHTNLINDWVMDVEANDPWVEATFGIKGTGEGLVFYPVSTPHLGWEMFSTLCFKAKGEAHKNIATAKPAEVNALAAANAASFVEMVLTEARLEQGATVVSPGIFDQKQTGKFVSWCLADVQKECQDELEASQLTWKDVQKSLSEKARQWYLMKAKG
jgi:hypothetical protein